VNSKEKREQGGEGKKENNKRPAGDFHAGDF
jgi:hypothetical protein